MIGYAVKQAATKICLQSGVSIVKTLVNEGLNFTSDTLARDYPGEWKKRDGADVPTFVMVVTDPSIDIDYIPIYDDRFY